MTGFFRFKKLTQMAQKFGFIDRVGNVFGGCSG